QKAILLDMCLLRLSLQQHIYFPAHTCGGAFTHRYRAGNTDDERQLLLISSEKLVVVVTQFNVVLDMQFQQMSEWEINFLNFRNVQRFVQCTQLPNIITRQIMIKMSIQTFPFLAYKLLIGTAQ